MFAWLTTRSHNGLLPSTRLPVSVMRQWGLHISSADGMVYYNNRGGIGHPDYRQEDMPVDRALLLNGIAVRNLGGIAPAPFTGTEIYSVPATQLVNVQG